MVSSPFDELERMFREMNRQLEEATGEVGGGLRPSIGRGIEVDVADRGDEFEVTADLPGYRTDEIDVTLAGRTLRIEAERRRETGTEGGDASPTGDTAGGEERYVRRERRQESARRSVQLPDPIDPEDVTAEYHNGVLTVTIPKMDGSEGHRIEVE
jgi:HSP20 family protein